MSAHHIVLDSEPVIVPYKGDLVLGANRSIIYLILSLGTITRRQKPVSITSTTMPSMEQVLNRTWLLSGEANAHRKLRVCVSHDHSWLIPPTKLDSIVVVSSLYIHTIYSLLRTQQ